MLVRIIIGLIGVVAGFFIVWRADKVTELVGEQAWMEKVLGPGHAVDGFKIIGVVVIIISFLITTGLINAVLSWIFSPVINSGI